MPRSEAVRDPIHGYIAITPLERRGLDSREVQRLRRIAQLGLTELVYPGARHSRFEHAVGALAVVTRLFEELRGRVGLDSWFAAVERTPTENEFQHLVSVARWTALLHDVGHAPFSHVTESLLPSGETHEDRTLRLVRGGEVGRVIAEWGAQLLEDVLLCLDPHCEPEDPALAFVREAISGPLGADRMDYLLRDSWGTGVSYGIFDLDRIVHTVLPVEREDRSGVRLGIDRGGVSATDGMLWARASMFGQVYQHRTRRILDIHLCEFLTRILPDGCYPRDDAAYLEWDDPRVWNQLRVAAGDPTDRGHADALRILRRGHHRALPERIEGDDPAEIEVELHRWKEAALALDPAFDPRVDLVVLARDPSRSGEIPVCGGVERGRAWVPLREVSDLIDRLTPRPFGRIYIANPLRHRGEEIRERMSQG